MCNCAHRKMSWIARAAMIFFLAALCCMGAADAMAADTSAAAKALGSAASYFGYGGAILLTYIAQEDHRRGLDHEKRLSALEGAHKANHR